ncbi:MAG: hypothetical protein AAGJ82_13410, partial [Bacteroidota bacterium]
MSTQPMTAEILEETAFAYTIALPGASFGIDRLLRLKVNLLGEVLYCDEGFVNYPAPAQAIILQSIKEEEKRRWVCYAHRFVRYQLPFLVMGWGTVLHLQPLVEEIWARRQALGWPKETVKTAAFQTPWFQYFFKRLIHADQVDRQQWTRHINRSLLRHITKPRRQSHQVFLPKIPQGDVILHAVYPALSDKNQQLIAQQLRDYPSVANRDFLLDLLDEKRGESEWEMSIIMGLEPHKNLELFHLLKSFYFSKTGLTDGGVAAFVRYFRAWESPVAIAVAKDILARERAVSYIRDLFEYLHRFGEY